MKEIVGAHAREDAAASASSARPSTSALGSTSAAHGFAEQDAKRKALNEFIRTSAACSTAWSISTRSTLDPATGEHASRSSFPKAPTGGPGDKLHPNRAGYLAMGNAIDLEW